MAALGVLAVRASKADYAMDNVAGTEKQTLTHYLISDGLIDLTVAKNAASEAIKKNMSLITYLVKEQIVSSDAVFACCHRNVSLPVYDEKKYAMTDLQHPAVKYDLMARYRALPLRVDDDTLHLGIADPTDDTAIAAITFHTGLHVQPVLMKESTLDTLLNHFCRPHVLYAQVESTLSRMLPLEESAILEDVGEEDEPVIALVNHLLQDALQHQISDIHIEPYAAHCRIRFRRDGLLYEAANLPAHLTSRITTRLKIMANMNIAERRLPQDGRFQWQPHKMDIRINSYPTLHGEKIVLRILNKSHVALDIHALGLDAAQAVIFEEIILRPQGLILVTGPTGSGKTVTLYSILAHLNHIEKNIATIEDPVEIEMTGVNQLAVHPRIGLDFSTALRALLRQDPDIIMVGEIRDAETAAIAIHAAQTGHLVLSTLHTNSAADTIIRLQAMGIPTHQLVSALTLIIAQRLVRKLCDCKQSDPDHPNRYHAAGCQHCHHGFRGRTGIFELLPLSTSTVTCILSGASHQDLCTHMHLAGWRTLWETGNDKINAGITTQTELARVIHTPTTS